MSPEYKPSPECSIRKDSNINKLYGNPTLHVFLNLAMYTLGITTSVSYVNSKWEKDLVDKGYAEYNSKTKAFNLCSADEIVINTNDKTVIGDVPFGISTASTYIKYLLNEVKDRKQEIDILEKQLFEKENLLEKHKKSTENHKKSG